MIKTFRGLLADGGQDRIRLQTIKGKVGYRITKFQIFPAVQDSAKDNLVVILKNEPTAAVTTANFTDSDLLASALMYNGTYETQIIIVFDTEIINQDIYITNIDSIGSNKMNYYIELEVIPLDDAGAEYTTLKDLRQV